MNVRNPARAGSFYDDEAASCRRHAQKLLDSAELPADLPSPVFGGLAPHAGWLFSGRLSAMTLKALAAAGPPRTIVIFGADHTGAVEMGEVYDSGAWRTPLGEVAIDHKLAAALLKAGEPLRANPAAHEEEHSIEVQVPLVQLVAPQASIVPVAVPPIGLAVRIGEIVGRILAKSFPNACVMGSTDLTHHGGHFGHRGGNGRAGVEWSARNDRRMLDLIENMAAEKVIDEAARNGNACGAGAIAATIAACRAMGATAGRLLEYTNSYEVMRDLYPGQGDDTTVGYASAIFA